MRLLIYFSLFLLTVIGCKDDKMDAAPGSLQSMEGRWKLVEKYSQTLSQPGWVPVPDSLQTVITFQADGIPLDNQGLPTCCRPLNYILNSKLVEVKSQSIVNPNCASVDCIYCPTWEITLTADELIITVCTGNVFKYRRM